MQSDAFADPDAVAAALDRAGYLPDAGVATAAYLAMRLGRPLFLEGDPGVGKTALAHALAEITGSSLVRLQCYEGIDASQALYDWDFPRQVLHLRAAGDGADVTALEASLYDRRFLVARPILQALENSPSVLLVDEIDRADDEFEAFLLEVLADNAVTIPELGTIRAAVPPLVVLTSNRTREVHDALKRRCLYHWVAHPSFEREVQIVRRHIPDVSEQLARDVAAVVGGLREADLLKPPGVAETIDWTQALHVLGQRAPRRRARGGHPRRRGEVPRGPGAGSPRDPPRPAGPVGMTVVSFSGSGQLYLTTEGVKVTIVEPVDVVASLTGFARALRAAGVNADRARLTTALCALAELDPGNADHVYWSARLAFCGEPDDLPRFDALFDLWFRGARPTMSGPPSQQAPPQELTPVARLDRGSSEEESERGGRAAHRRQRRRDPAPPRRRHSSAPTSARRCTA